MALAEPCASAPAGAAGQVLSSVRPSVRPADEDRRRGGRSAGPCRSCLSQLGPTVGWSPGPGSRPLLSRSPRHLALHDNGGHRAASRGFCGSVGGARPRGPRSWACTLSQTRTVAGAGQAPPSLRPSRVTRAVATRGSRTAGRPRGSRVASVPHGAPRPGGFKGQLGVRAAPKTEPRKSHGVTCNSTNACVWPKSRKSPPTPVDAGLWARTSPRDASPLAALPPPPPPRLPRAGLVLAAGWAPLHA